MPKRESSKTSSANKTLYRKYRSRQLPDIIGQAHVTDTLGSSIKAGRTSHAYLFSGPRGVGKTSVARILAHLVNNLDYSDDSQHLDIIEIDAASNRGIDDIRDLREKVHIAPIQARYKIYIIDEVHMLTTHSFNALLKTLEEPPEHVIFILATTEPHKLPDTITSRTQHYKFKPVDVSQVSNLLQDIAKNERIKFDSQALDLIAQHGQGSVRDSISMFDQIASAGQKITTELVENTLGLVPKQTIEELVNLLETADLKAISQKLDDLVSQGIDSQVFARQLYQSLKHKLVSDSANPRHNLGLMQALLEASKAYDSQLFIESALLKYVLERDNQAEVEASPNSTAATRPKTSNKSEGGKTPKVQLEPADEQISSSSIEETTSHESINTYTTELENGKWQQIIDYIKTTHNTLAGLLNQTQAMLENDTLQIVCPYSFHVKRLQTSAYQTKLAEAAQQFIGQTVSLSIVHQPSGQTSPAEANEEVVIIEQSPSLGKLEAIKNIMGGGEVINV